MLNQTLDMSRIFLKGLIGAIVKLKIQAHTPWQWSACTLRPNVFTKFLCNQDLCKKNFVVWLNPNRLMCGKVALMDDLLHRMWLVESTKDGDNMRSQALEEATFLLLLCYFAYDFVVCKLWTLVCYFSWCTHAQVLVMEHNFHDPSIVWWRWLKSC
jgi:hypothetical protein